MYINNIPTVYLSIVSMPQGCKSLANNGETMRWHMMGSQKVYLEYVQHTYIYIYVYVCVSCQYIYIYVYVKYIYIYIANFRIPHIHEWPPTVLFVRYHVTSWN